MAGVTKKREARKSLRQSGWITLDGGFAARPAWFRICRLRAPRSRWMIRASCRAGCGWRLRATPGPGGIAKWSGAGESHWASNSSGSQSPPAR